MDKNDKTYHELVAIIKDLKQKISKYKNTNEYRTRLDQEYFRTIFNDINDAIFILNQYGFILDVNKKAEELLGYNRKELLQKSILDISSSEKLDLVIRQIYESGILQDMTFKSYYLKQNGSKIPVEIKIRMLDHSRPILINVSRDLSYHKDMEKALRESEEKYKSTLSSMVDLVLILNTNMKFVDYYHPQGTPDFCISKKKIIGNTYKDVFPKRVVENFDAAIETLLATKEPIQFDYYFTKKEQFDYRSKIADYDTWYRTKLSIRNNYKGEFDGITVVMRDITKNKRSEDELYFALVENENIIRAISSILIGVDKENIITHWNDHAEKNFKYPGYEMIGQNFNHFKIDWDWDMIQSTIKKVMQDKNTIQLQEIKCKIAGRMEGFLNITISPFISDTDELLGFFMLCNDITEHKLLKEVVTEYKKIESVGHLAASIAQQINPTGQSPREDIPYLQNTCTNLRMLLDKCKQLFSDNNFKYIQKFPGRSLRH